MDGAAQVVRRPLSGAALALVAAAALAAATAALAVDEGAFARYRDAGHLSGLIGNYLATPGGALSMDLVGEYKLTFYWITRERPQDGARVVKIRILKKETGAEDGVAVSTAFKERLDREGTAILEDGRVINVLRRGETQRYLDISKAYPTGLGSANNQLTPFVSVAVSEKNRDLKFGDTVFIPDAKGMPLPDGGRHDGVFKVHDTGRIAVDQIDVFTFVEGNWPEFERYLKTHVQKAFVYKVLARPTKRAARGR